MNHSTQFQILRIATNSCDNRQGVYIRPLSRPQIFFKYVKTVYITTSFSKPTNHNTPRHRVSFRHFIKQDMCIIKIVTYIHI
ncbi:hypothetical protein Hanom_Chr05g00390871 [Helianthus anomalus]